jgi:hypothetical protein
MQVKSTNANQHPPHLCMNVHMSKTKAPKGNQWPVFKTRQYDHEKSINKYLGPWSIIVSNSKEIRKKSALCLFV